MAGSFICTVPSGFRHVAVGLGAHSSYYWVMLLLTAESHSCYMLPGHTLLSSPLLRGTWAVSTVHLWDGRMLAAMFMYGFWVDRCSILLVITSLLTASR
jgi:hypothetical protein